MTRIDFVLSYMGPEYRSVCRLSYRKYVGCRFRYLDPVSEVFFFFFFFGGNHHGCSSFVSPAASIVRRYGSLQQLDNNSNLLSSTNHSSGYRRASGVRPMAISDVCSRFLYRHEHYSRVLSTYQHPDPTIFGRWRRQNSNTQSRRGSCRENLQW